MIDKIVTLPNAILALAVWAILVTVRKLRPATESNRSFQRALPLLPPILGVLGSLIGLGSGVGFAEKIAIGLIFGTIAGQGFKIGKTSILGVGLPPKATKPAATLPAPTPTPPKG
jgi:hypothetical protein